MFSLIKQAAAITLGYVLIFTGVFWGFFFLMVVVQVFWKIILAGFIGIMTVLTWQHYNLTAELKHRFNPMTPEQFVAKFRTTS